ncbi:MAG: ROK family protein, partial [Pseudonocardia sp.]
MTAVDVVGVDIGGTKIAAGVVDDRGTVLRRATCPTPSAGVLDAVAALVGRLTERPGPVGVAAPGVIDLASGSVRSATDTLPGWVGTPVRAELEARLGVPVRVDNDVRAMARGEAWAGAGRDHADALYVSVGTGIGGALHRGGEVVRGPHALAGEIAHLLVPVPAGFDGVCGCGRADHLEAAASGPAIERAYRHRTGRRSGLREIAASMRAGDEEAAAVITA